MSHSRPSAEWPLHAVLVIPDGGPDMGRVIRAAATPHIMNTFVVSKKVICTGHITLEVEYAPAGNTGQPVCFTEFTVPFAHYVSHKKAAPHLEASISATIEFQSLDILNRRTVASLHIVRLRVMKLAPKQAYTPTHICLLEHITQHSDSADPGHQPATGTQTVMSLQRRTAHARRLWNGRYSYH